METGSENTPSPRPKRRKALRIAGIAVAAVLVIVLVVALAINTGPGRNFLANRISNLQPESGLRVQIGRIDGSLYSDFIIHDLRLYDLDGVFLHIPRAEVDWKPGALASKHVVLNRVHAPRLVFSRIPRLNETPKDPNAPLFPDIDVTLGQLTVDRVIIGPQVAGKRYVARASASGLLRDGRLKLDADVAADAGDRVRLKAAIGPEDDMLDLAAQVTAPVGGLVSGMTGLDKPLTLTLDGEGSWSRWDGALASRLGEDDLLTLQISGRNGTFSLAGRAAPALLLEEGPATRILAPGINVRSILGFDLPHIDMSFTASAPAFSVKAAGMLNTETSNLRNFKVNARLTEPAAIMEGVSGNDVVLTALVNGPLSAPEVSYEAAAERIGYEGVFANDLQASGTLALSGTGDMTMPVALSLRSVDGLNEAAAGLLARLRLEGVVRVTPETVSADKVAFASQHLTGQASFRQVPSSGAYKANVDARLSRYTVPNLGTFEGTVDAVLGSDPRTDALTMDGDLQVQALRLDNETARDLLGGRAVLEASVRQRADGGIVVRKGTLQAPEFQFNVTHGVYTRDGRLDLAATGQSAVYGPFSLSAAGQATQPTVQASMANPGLGFGLKDVKLSATPEPDGYFLTLSGQSPQGDLNGRARIILDQGPIKADIEHLQLADLRLRGQVQQTEQGPFKGLLALNGAGLNGSVRLAAEGDVQRVDANLQARRARPPMLPALAIGEGSLQASLRLPESGPDVTANLSARLVQYGQWRIETMSGTANYVDGTGKASLAVEGRYKSPFELKLAATMEPDRALLDINGALKGQRIRLAEPAVAQKTETGWRLQPTTMVLAGGKLVLEGETGETTTAQARWTGLNLRFLDTLDPELGFSGSSSGTLTFALPADGATPNADLRMVVSRLQRAGLTTVSPPLDLGVNASLSEQQAAVRMLLRHEKNVVGSVQARLDMGPPEEATWTEQLWRAPLDGGLRFNGPVELLWAMSGLKGQELGGNLTVAADMSGTLEQPMLRGAIRTTDMTYENIEFGTRVQNLALDARFSGSRLRLVSLTGTTPGDGKLSASGYADLNPAQNFPMNVEISLDHFRAARTDAVQAVVTGPITIRRDRNGELIAGNIRINEARYRFSGAAAEAVPLLDVERIGEVPVRVSGSTTDGQDEPPLNFDLNVKVSADNRIFIEGMGLNSEWSTNLTVGGTLYNPLITGTVEVVRGNYSFAGRRFDLNRGIIRFGGNFPPNPTLDIEAGATVEGVEALLLVTGSAKKPEINFSSSPVLPQDEILSRLLFGGSAAELSATEALQLAAALASLQGSGGDGGLNPLGKMRQATNVDRLRIVGADEATGRGTSLAVGQYLTDDVYVEVSSDTRGNTLTQLQIELTKALSILSQVGQTGSSSLQLQYAKDY